MENHHQLLSWPSPLIIGLVPQAYQPRGMVISVSRRNIPKGKSFPGARNGPTLRVSHLPLLSSTHSLLHSTYLLPNFARYLDGSGDKVVNILTFKFGFFDPITAANYQLLFLCWKLCWVPYILLLIFCAHSSSHFSPL